MRSGAEVPDVLVVGTVVVPVVVDVVGSVADVVDKVEDTVPVSICLGQYLHHVILRLEKDGVRELLVRDLVQEVAARDPAGKHGQGDEE